MLTDLLSRLAQRPHTDDSYNPYFSADVWGAQRLQNLQHYLTFMLARRPTTLMLMEAPGYRGCRVTGIPVTSRSVLFSGVLGKDYADIHETGFEGYQKEQSATIVWETLTTLPALPLIWNTFPFHPHLAGTLHSNRTPRPAETREGLDYVKTLCDLFQPQTLIAVGKIAAKAFTQMGITYTAVRHPAQGGKNDFVRGMRDIFLLS